MILKKVDKLYIAEQLYLLIDADLPIQLALTLLISQSDDQLISNIINEVSNDIEAGFSLTEALKKHNQHFPDLFIAMVKVGEQTGKLAEAFSEINQHYLRENKLKAEIKQLLYYPVIVLIVTFLAGIFFIWQVLPTFSRIFSDFSKDLPLLTMILLNSGEFIKENIFYLLMFLFLFILAIFYLLSTEKAVKFIKNYLLYFPIIGKLYQYSILSNLAGTMSMLLESGLDLITTLKISNGVINNNSYQKIMEETELIIRKGGRLSSSLNGNKLIPKIYYQLIITGEETGRLSLMLNKAALLYQQKLEKGTKKLLTLLEPALIVFMAAIVGLLAVTVVLPIFQLYTVIG